MLPRRIKLPCGAVATWSVPLSGFGHVADEQPTPYITYRDIELTPRYGGEENNDKTGIGSLPLPWGKLNNKMPLKQRLFNLTKRRANIYWRNLLKVEPNRRNHFYFAEQLNFKSGMNGFSGDSPLVNFSREFSVLDNSLIVEDTIEFKQKVSFKTFNFSNYGVLECSTDNVKIDFSSKHLVNHNQPILSSTGNGVVKSHRVEDKIYYSGDIERTRIQITIEVAV